MQPANVTDKTTARVLSLDRFVEGVIAVAPEGGRLRYDWLPDGRTTLVFRALDGGRRGDLAVFGPRTRALFKQAEGVTRGLVVPLRPGWTDALLGVPAHELSDRVVRVASLWGRVGRELDAALLAAGDPRELFERMSAAFGARLAFAFESSSARLARRAARLLERGEVRVDRVAAQLGVTSRHLRRAFRQHVGLPPKEYARQARLQRALRLATGSNGGPRDWGRIAAEAGYYDQAHLIGDFRDLVGLTPGAFLRRQRA